MSAAESPLTLAEGRVYHRPEHLDGELGGEQTFGGADKPPLYESRRREAPRCGGEGRMLLLPGELHAPGGALVCCLCRYHGRREVR